MSICNELIEAAKVLSTGIKTVDNRLSNSLHWGKGGVRSPTCGSNMSLLFIRAHISKGIWLDICVQKINIMSVLAEHITKTYIVYWLYHGIL